MKIRKTKTAPNKSRVQGGISSNVNFFFSSVLSKALNFEPGIKLIVIKKTERKNSIGIAMMI
ncbi:hypothetical protein [Chengkuizengella sediminis]|uniref:hypothetical protein n=1 Tax=Chengkuizengella sediminis TaxID=1885917 RepID=UPI001389F852|nr:hypothetical protein [Chengkuizengella sediminis]NDI36642.1 hypothetical protein [Chengkuizengella sediminis]